jgi:protein SCO1/2
MVTSTMIRSFLVCSLLLLASCAPEGFKGTDISGVEWGGDFELTAHTGKRVRSSEFRGKALVIFFGYTHCPDICAPTLVRLAQTLKQLGPGAERVQVFFITVDPRHDTPAQLAGFVPTFHPSFLGLTGSDRELAAVARNYRVVYEPDPTHPDQIPHSGMILVKDAQGKPRLLFKNDTAAEDIAHDLRLLLKQG